MSALDDRVRELVALHFHPRLGAPFWIERADRLGLDPRRALRGLADLARLGPFPLAALAERPVTDWLPRAFRDRGPELVAAETGGTTGPPKRTLFRRDEFEAAFVAPFLAAAGRVGFPRGVPWLFLGPSGPHPIGKAARACATAWGAPDPFAVDFDPRWVRRLPEGSLARRRYLEHVLAQAEAVLATQEVGVLFATPPVLDALGERLPDRVREAVSGIHLGGLPATPDFRRRLAERFPKAVALAGYGNSLAGMCPELAPSAERPPEYFPHGARLVLEVDAPAGARGRVRLHRLDESALYPNVLERDVAEAAPAPEGVPGFALPGVRDPRPPEGAPAGGGGGLY